MKNETGPNWSLLVRIALVSLVVYNLIFAWGKFYSSFLTGIITPIFEAIQSSLTALTFFELIGIVSVFVDLIGRWDKLSENASRRNLRTALIGLLLMAFIFKLFVNYLDSAYLES